jgi:hypothetical protein
METPVTKKKLPYLMWGAYVLVAYWVLSVAFDALLFVPGVAWLGLGLGVTVGPFITIGMLLLAALLLVLALIDGFKGTSNKFMNWFIILISLATIANFVFSSIRSLPSQAFYDSYNAAHGL